MKRILLDTSAYSLLLRGKTDVANALDLAEEVFVPVIVIGELLAGFNKGGFAQSNRDILNRFLSTPKVATLILDEDAAERYAIIWAYLRDQGTPIPSNDLWIAACAMQHGLAIVTGDRHFLRLPQVLTRLIE